MPTLNNHRLVRADFQSAYGVFYVVKPEEIRVLAVLHASRDTEEMLAERRRTFNQF